jgi:hypothetical protein
MKKLILGVLCALCGESFLCSAQVKFNPGVKINPGVRFSRAVLAAQVPTLAQPIAYGSTSATFAQAQTAHNLNVVVIGWNDATRSITGVADTTGNSYAEAAPTATYTSGGASLRQAIWYAKNITAHAAGNVVTVAWDGTPTLPDVRAVEFAGLDQTNPLDTSTAKGGTYTGTVPVSVGTDAVSTSAASELLVGAGMTSWAYSGLGVNFQGLIRPTTLAEYRVVQAAGSYAADAMLAGYTQNWLMSLATFKAAGQTEVAPPPTLTSVTPNSGTTAGNTAVTLGGSNFVSGATVTFGGAAAANVVVVSNASITASTPAHAAGVVDVSVTDPGAPSATLANAYTYTAPPASTDRYVSTTGSDAAAGSQGSPWATLQYAANHVPAGGTIHVAAGTYNPALIDCAAGATQGASAAPITLISDSERQAFIQGNGLADPLKIQNCSYWTVEGFRAEDGDHTTYSDAVIYLYQTNHITLRRNLLRKSNRYKNATLITVDHSSNTVVEENELYEFHKHGLSFYYGAGNGRNIARRNYCNSRGGVAGSAGADIDGGYVSDDPLRGDQCISVYAESNCLLENNVAENVRYAVEVQPGGTAPADGTALWGNIANNTVQGFHLEANSGDPQTEDDAHMPHNTVLTDNIAISGYDTTAGFSSESAKNTVLDRNTAITVNGQTGFQFIRHDDNGGDGTYSAHVDHALATQASGEAQGNGFYAYASSGTLSTTGEGINAFNWLTPFTGLGSVTSQATSDPQLGGCKAWRPDGSWAKLNAVGADVLYRYDNGTLTTTPLWDESGNFPSGTIIAGWNDVVGSSLSNLKNRLAVNTASCPFPAGYGTGAVARTLTVSITGTGHVTSVPAGVNCPGTCAAAYNAGTSVHLTATADGDATFNGWSGACSGTGACNLTMDANKAVSATFASPPPPTGVYSMTTPPPYNWQPFVAGGQTGANGQKSIFYQPLPNNCYDQAGASCTGGIMGHSINDAMAKYTLTANQCSDHVSSGYSSTGCGYWALVFPSGTAQARSVDQGIPYYYCKPDGSDCVWYKTTNRGLNVTFLAPNRAMYSGGDTDMYIGVLDQKQNISLQTYTYFGTGNQGRTLPDNAACPGTGPKTCAKLVDLYWVNASHTGVDADFYNNTQYTDSSTGYTLGGDSGGTTGLSGSALGFITRFQEYAGATSSNYATINHAIQLGFKCGYKSGSPGAVSDKVWPQITGLKSCTQTGDYNVAGVTPEAGRLFMFDYTKAQIDAMSIDPAKKALLRAYSRYGGYFAQTGGSLQYGFTAVCTGGYESLTSYQSTNTPFPEFNTIATRNPNITAECGASARGRCPQTRYDVRLYDTFTAGIGRLVGPGGTDSQGNSCSVAPGCYPSGHFHVVSECVAKAMAGMTVAQGACP